MSNAPLPGIVAHRGNAAEYPENTLEALGSAVALGARYVEFDVQLTADQVPVLLHDADLQRVAGRPDRVHEISWARLAACSVGEPARFGTRYAAVRPPSLEQLAASLKGWAGVTAFVEIKRASLRAFGHERVVNRLIETLAPVRDRCVLISFDPSCLALARRIARVRIGWVLTQYDAKALSDARDLAPEFLFADLERLPAGDVPLESGPWDWAIYEIRDLATARRCGDRGARLVETMAVRDLVTAYERSSNEAG